eukprot:a187784_28.p2 GENE.a187784_28~~a187784_28.p2  ORF type:complete len:299 (-),score=109.21 a187784_28:1-807(-)
MAGGFLVLSNGVRMPQFGFGTYQIPPDLTYDAVAAALRAGYRLIDTAAIYGNEAEVGRAIRDSGIPREQIFVTTKLWHRDHDAVAEAFERSLAKLGTPIDLYLMHWPAKGTRHAAWKAMEELYKAGRVRAIGVSNFLVKHLEPLLDVAEIKPHVNQLEMTPYLQNNELLALCGAHNVAITAYASLTQGAKLQDPPLVAIATKHGKTTAAVLLRWALERGLAVIPKSLTESRIVENTAALSFRLDAEDMAALDALDEGFRTCWNPHGVE